VVMNQSEINATATSLNVEGIIAGTYLMRVKTPNGEVTQKVIIQ
jgi:hypothetical protein